MSLIVYYSVILF